MEHKYETLYWLSNEPIAMTLKGQRQGHVYISLNMHFSPTVSMGHEYETLYWLSNEPIPVT
jgi:hypothetical protein